MTMEESLVSFLGASSAVTAIVGSRIFPAGRVPKGEDFPYVTYHRVSTVPLLVMNAAVQPGKRTSTFQIDCWGRGPGHYALVNTLAAAVKAADGGIANGPKLHGFTGTMAGTSVKRCLLQDERRDFSTDNLAGEATNHSASLDFEIEYVEN